MDNEKSIEQLVQDVRDRYMVAMKDKEKNPNMIGNNDQTIRMRISRQVTVPKKILDGEGGMKLSYAELTVSSVLLLAKAIPELSMEWLIKGEGKPYHDGRPIAQKESMYDLDGMLSRIETLEKQLRGQK